MVYLSGLLPHLPNFRAVPSSYNQKHAPLTSQKGFWRACSTYSRATVVLAKRSGSVRLEGKQTQYLLSRDAEGVCWVFVMIYCQMSGQIDDWETTAKETNRRILATSFGMKNCCSVQREGG